MRRFRTNDANVQSQTKKMLMISGAVAFPATRPGQAILGFAGRRTLLAVEGIVMDPIGSIQRTNTMLNTYKRMGQAVALYESLSKFGDSYKSLASSSSSYQQNGDASDTLAFGDDIRKPNYPIRSTYKGTRRHRREIRQGEKPCPPGWRLAKVQGKWMCVRKHNRK